MKDKIIPFSNGTESMCWYDSNCDQCVKSFKPKDGEYPSDKTMKNYCSIGKECKLKYALDYSHITGEMLKHTAKQIGWSEDKGMPQNCLMFSDDSDDGYTPPKKPQPDNVPDNQMLLFSIADEVFEEQKELA